MYKSTKSIRPLKQFGQHFLKDDTVVSKIINAAELKANEPVWEIGPGYGVLTERILEHTNNLTAFEIDNRLSVILTNRFADKINLVNRDILALNWQKLLSEQFETSHQKVRLVSNLPYQITSPVLYALEENEKWFSGAIIMIQKEVAERLTAEAGCKAYGVLTLKLKFVFDTELLFNVPPEAFEPPPKVHSSVVRLTPRIDRPQPKSLDTYRLIINKAFTQRRKTLRNNMRSLFVPEDLKRLETSSGLDFNRRGETIEEGEYIRLADCAFDLSCH